MKSPVNAALEQYTKDFSEEKRSYVFSFAAEYMGNLLEGEVTADDLQSLFEKHRLSEIEGAEIARIVLLTPAR